MTTPNPDAGDRLITALLELEARESGASLAHVSARRLPSPARRMRWERIALAAGTVALLIVIGLLAWPDQQTPSDPNPVVGNGEADKDDDSADDQADKPTAKSTSIDLTYYDASQIHDGLSNVTLRGTSITDEQVAKLVVAAPKIERLTLFNTMVTGDGLKSLRKLEQLTALSLSHSRLIDDDAINGLYYEEKIQTPYLKQLRELDLTGFVGGTASSFGGQPSPPSPYSKITDASAAALAQMDKLEVLRLFGTKIGDHTISTLAKGPAGKSLRVLELGFTRITQASVAHLAEMPALRDLAIQSTPIQPEHWERLHDLKQITALTVGGNGKNWQYVEDHHRKSLSGMHWLRSLDLQFIRSPGLNVPSAREDAPKAIAFDEFTQLTRLSLWGAKISPLNPIRTIGLLTNLEELELIGMPELGLSNGVIAQVTARGASSHDKPILLSLADLTKLRRLNLRGSGPIPLGVLLQLKQALPNCEITDDKGQPVPESVVRVVVDDGTGSVHREASRPIDINFEPTSLVALVTADGKVAAIGKPALTYDAERCRRLEALSGVPQRTDTSEAAPVLIGHEMRSVEHGNYRLLVLSPGSKTLMSPLIVPFSLARFVSESASHSSDNDTLLEMQGFLTGEKDYGKQMTQVHVRVAAVPKPSASAMVFLCAQGGPEDSESVRVAVALGHIESMEGLVNGTIAAATRPFRWEKQFDIPGEPEHNFRADLPAGDYTAIVLIIGRPPQFVKFNVPSTGSSTHVTIELADLSPTD